MCTGCIYNAKITLGPIASYPMFCKASLVPYTIKAKVEEKLDPLTAVDH